MVKKKLKDWKNLISRSKTKLTRMGVSFFYSREDGKSLLQLE